MTKEQDDSSKKDEVVKSSGNEYFINGEKYLRLHRSSAKDEVEGNYIVNINKPLPEFDSSTAKAFAVTNKHDKSAENHYALILDKKYPVRLAEINKLLELQVPHFTNVVAAQIINSDFGKGNFFTIIVEKPPGVSLKEYIEKNGAQDEDFVVENVIAQVASVIKYFEAKDIVHGRINLESIYIDSNKNVTLCEGFSELCGASQQLLFETMARAASMPTGKGRGVPGCTDYYALGVVAAILLRGRNPAAGMTEKEVLELKFASNTYKIVADAMEFSPHIMDFLRGVVNDKSKEIWSSSHVAEWVKGRQFNLLPPGDSVEAGRPIIFEGKKYVNKKYLAYALHDKWDEAKKFIREDTLVRWIERSVLDKDLAEKMEVLANRSSSDISEAFDRDDELLAQYIMLLDQTGPIRIKGFSACLDGIGTMLAEGYANDKKSMLLAVEIVILHSLHTYVSFDKFASMAGYYKEYSMVIQQSMDLLRKRDLGFSLERCLYEMNPTIACQGNVIGSYSIYTIEEMLKTLNNEESIGSNLVDKHIASFLSNRLDLPTKIRITSLVRFADFATNYHIQTLSLLSLAQETTGLRSLNKLTVKLCESLQGVVDEFHSKYVRKDINESLKKVEARGHIPDLLKIITDTQFLVRDRLGYRKAVTRYRNNAMQIIRLGNRKAVNNMGYRYGLHLSVLLSFFITTVVIIVLMLKAF